MSKKKTHEEYLEEVKSISPHIIVKGMYIDAKTPIEHFCSIHAISWYPRPYNVLMGKCCPVCKQEKIHDKITFTHEQYVEMAAKSNPGVVPVEKYINMNTPISHYHEACGHTTKMVPHIVLKGHGCVLCKGKKIGKARVKSQDDFEQELLQINPHIKVNSQYKTIGIKVDCECTICGCLWRAKPNHLLAGHGCPKCATDRNADKLRKSHEEFLKEIAIVNPYITIVSKYISYDKEITCKCNLCSHIWESSPSMLIRGRGCPKCKESTGERIIRKYLEIRKIPFIKNKRFKQLVGIGGKPLSYDFYLPTHNTLIEFQGEQHEHAVELYGGEAQFEIQKEHDNRKYQYAISNNYNFLEIYYKDMQNIESILDNFINTLKSETVTTTGAAQ